MIIARPSGPALTSVEVALAMLLDGTTPVAAADETLAAAVGGISAGTAPLAGPLPASDEAAADGFAFFARDLVGASSYSPVAPAVRPAWVEAGDAMPAGCDCVLEAELVDTAGPILQVLAEAIPGQGVRRAGEDLAAGATPVGAGRPISTLDLLIARRAGLDRLATRRPRLRLVDVGAASTATTEFVAESARAAGAKLAGVATAARDAASIGAALDAGNCDLLVIVGGTGAGRTDHTAEALFAHGIVALHGIALQPGRTTAIGRLGNVPIVALPGAPDQALGAYLALVQPILHHLSGRQTRQAPTRPLAKKISSGIGVTELVLLAQAEGAWVPLATGAFPLHCLGEAEAWLAVPGGSEGFAAGTPVAGLPLPRMA